MAADAAPLRGARVLVTAGPTREPLDPVRFLTNASTGAMGYALAAEARRRGAEVLLVSGPVSIAPPAGVKLVKVGTALEMLREVLKEAPGCDALIGAAAVGDWRAQTARRTKLKRGPGVFTLRLVPNPDILAEVARRRAARGGEGPIVLAGFALETSRLLARARDKMERKGLDLIVANGPANLGAASGEVVLLEREGGKPERHRGTKARLAARILDAVQRRLAGGPR